MPHDHDDDFFDGGFREDLARLRDRRRALSLIAGAGAGLVLAACGGKSSDSSAGTTTTTTAAGASSTTTTAGRGGPPSGGGPGGGGGGEGGGMGGESTLSSGDENAIPNETAGPYPGDGSNGPDVLLEDGVVRSDITTSIGDASSKVSGVPLAVTFTVTDSSTGKPLAGRAVYAWHCDAEGRYSMYSDGVEDDTWLRGVQVADDDGKVTFETIFPGCYQGRWPHIHFEVYGDLATATSSGEITATSQLAFPAEECAAVYETSGYEASVQPFSGVSLTTDGIFADSYQKQTATMAGSVAKGYTAALTVPVTA